MLFEWNVINGCIVINSRNLINGCNVINGWNVINCWNELKVNEILNGGKIFFWLIWFYCI